MRESAVVSITCAGCGYSLRGLPTDATCPECGSSVRTPSGPMENRAFAGVALGLACLGPVVAAVSVFDLSDRFGETISFSLPVAGAGLEIISIALAVLARRYPSHSGASGRTLSTVALSIAVPLALLLGCCGGIMIGALHGFFSA